MISTALTTYLPPDWSLSNLIRLDPDGWQANISDGEWVITATGETPDEAIQIAAQRSADERYYTRRLFHLPPRFEEPSAEGADLLARLNLLPKPEPIRRRI